MDDISRKVRKIKFWRISLAGTIEKTPYTGEGRDILYRLHQLSGGIIMGFDYYSGNSREAYKLMKSELNNLMTSEAFEVFSKFNHSLEHPVADEETYANIATMNELLDYLINS